ncbi:hypothetical protein RF11_11135 [Thelohanellus kitauei]|uniref:Uncharacterized protein n=1 Tax=Thelohanellus kitauei TaxID=669202 RepID=A0A0C2IJF2_THEKT|nr:hypothetical protein RF11_11135 [Thelohanellus kitauei]
MFEFQVFEQPEMSKENFVNIHRYVNTGFISDTSNYTSQAIGTAHGEELSKIGKSTKFPLVKQISDESEKRMSPITGLIPANDFYLKNTRFSDPGVSAESLPNFLPLEEIKSSKMFDFHVFEHPELSERTSKDLIQDELLLAIRTKQIKTEKKEYPIYNLEHLQEISNTFIGLNDSFIESKHKFETADEDVNQTINEYIQSMTLISPTLISKPLGQYASPKLEKLMQVSEIGLNINTMNTESITVFEYLI